MDRRIWDALDECEQEQQLAEARRVGFLLVAGFDGPDDGPFTHEQLVHALTVLTCEYERVVELEAQL